MYSMAMQNATRCQLATTRDLHPEALSSRIHQNPGVGGGSFIKLITLASVPLNILVKSFYHNTTTTLHNTLNDV